MTRLFHLSCTGIIALLLLCIPFGGYTESESENFSENIPAFLGAGETPVATENSYQSENVVITLRGARIENSDVFIADIYLKDITSFQRVFSTGEWKRSGAQKKVSVMGEESGAILAMTGDNSYNFDAGVVIGNGTLYRGTSNKKRDLCVLYTNGEMKTWIAGTVDPVQLAQEVTQAYEEDQVWQTFLFGPALLDDEGHAMTSFNTNVGVANPRSVIGYYEPGHYVFIQVDGRGTKSQLEAGRTNRGLTMTALSQLAEELGLACAYNLDGGQSSLLWFNGSVFSTPYKNGRKVADAVVICEPISGNENESEETSEE